MQIFLLIPNCKGCNYCFHVSFCTVKVKVKVDSALVSSLCPSYHACQFCFANLGLLIHSKAQLTNKLTQLLSAIWPQTLAGIQKHENMQCKTKFYYRSTAIMNTRYKFSVLLGLLLFVFVRKASQTISGQFIPTLNVTADQWSGEDV